MSLLFPTVTKDNPCPVCGHADWCALGDLKVKCMREVSDHPSKDGGWYHPYTDQRHVIKKAPFPRKAPILSPPESSEDHFRTLLIRWTHQTTETDLKRFSAQMSVEFDALKSLETCWSREHQSWAFPMKDENGKIVGIRLRGLNGKKFSVRGGHQGLFIPNFEQQETVFLPEGPTSTAAFLSVGLFAIGRPSCSGGVEQVRATLRKLKITKAVIMGDYDRKFRDDGTEWSPGIQGAESLATRIGCRYCIWTTPTKDARDFVKMGGTKRMILQAVSQLIWRR